MVSSEQVYNASWMVSLRHMKMENPDSLYDFFHFPGHMKTFQTNISLGLETRGDQVPETAIEFRALLSYKSWTISPLGSTQQSPKADEKMPSSASVFASKPAKSTLSLTISASSASTNCSLPRRFWFNVCNLFASSSG
ncbi:uncharacterized protein [Elaeis guineensis]|uniref:uncharacterized protein n=1 Tax=Elaeis guineensis var. tenera TaxID=51953 RepID=UPI003C6CFD7A